MKFSVIIPTYNRSKMLTEAIISVRAQTFADDSYEIIVVDNASQDDTRETVDQLNLNGGKQILYVYEANQGLHFARHSGARVAKGDILAYTDDDAIVESEWLAQLGSAYDELNVDAAGGKIKIRWDRKPPDWIAAYEHRLGAIDLGAERRLLGTHESINGGNFSIRRQYLYEIGGFAPAQCGDYVMGSDEVRLCRQIHARGGHIAWVPGALVWHCQKVAKHATLTDMRRRYINGGSGAAHEKWCTYQIGLAGLILWTVEAILRAAVNWGRVQRYRKGPEEDYIRLDLLKTHYLGQARYWFHLIRDPNFRRQVSPRDNWIIP